MTLNIGNITIESTHTSDDLAMKDEAWKALEQAVDEWIEANPDPQGKIKTHKDIGFLPPRLPFGWMTANDWESIERRADEICPPLLDIGHINTPVFEDVMSIDAQARMRASLPKTRTGEQLLEGAREWQARAYNMWLGLKRMCVKAATGAGKTRLATTIIHNWLTDPARRVPNKRQTVVFVVPSKSLLIQTKQVLLAWDLTIGLVGGGYMQNSPNKDVYITTYNSLHKVSSLKHIKEANVLLILDECHRAGGEKALAKLKKFQGDACLLLSATPNRSDGVCVMHEMNTHPEGSYCSGGDSCKVGIHFELSLIDGINQSRNGDDELDFTFHIVHCAMTPAEQIEYDDLSERISKKYHKCYKMVSESYGGNPHNLFDRRNWSLPSDVKRELSIYQALCNQRKRLMNDMDSRYNYAQQLLNLSIGRKSALFHETIFGIERLHGMCMELGIHPHVYHSGVSELPPDVFITYPELNNPSFIRRFSQWGDESDKELRRWMRSPSDALLTCKSLKEGFNAPDLEVIVMMSGTNQVRSRIQTIGRAFRGTGHKDIVMFVYPSGDSERPSGDERSLYELIHETGIPHDKIAWHTNGLNPAHFIVH